MSAAQPGTPKEAQHVAERINKELIEDATMQILSERGATRKSVIDALIDDKLNCRPQSGSASKSQKSRL